MIKPTIGRRVWYYPNGADEGFASDLVQPHDASVTYVHSDTMINLSVADRHGAVHARTSVPLVQEGEPTPPGAYCTWMPYQIGQAAAAKPPTPTPTLEP